MGAMHAHPFPIWHGLTFNQQSPRFMTGKAFLLTHLLNRVLHLEVKLILCVNRII